MLRKTVMMLLFVAALTAPAKAFACMALKISFNSYVERATDTLKSKRLEPAVREKAEHLLVLARDAKGPLWLGERQHGLDEAMELLGLPKTTPLFDELTAEQQEIQRREEAKATMAVIDELLSKVTLSDAKLAKVKNLRGQVAEMITAGKWSDAISVGTDALVALGAVFAAKC